MTRKASNAMLQELEKEHDDLHEAIAGIKQFWTEVNELGQGPKYEDMACRIHQLREQFRKHFAKEERDGGYLAPVVAASPPLASQVDQLKRQHQQFLEELDRFSERLQCRESAFQNWNEVHAEFEEFLEQLQEHESAEMALIRETCS